MSQNEDRQHLPGEVNAEEALAACPIDVEERLDTERVLGSFAPRAPRFNRERLLALVAGSSYSAPPSLTLSARTPWYWPAATAVMTATSLVLALLLLNRPESKAIEHIEYKDRVVYRDRVVEVPIVMTPAKPAAEQHGEQYAVTPPPALLTSGQDNYLRNRDVALSRGVDAIALSSPITAGGKVSPPATRGELLRQFVPATTMRSATTAPSWLGWPGW